MRVLSKFFYSKSREFGENAKEVILLFHGSTVGLPCLVTNFTYKRGVFYQRKRCHGNFVISQNTNKNFKFRAKIKEQFVTKYLRNYLIPMLQARTITTQN